VIVGGGWGGGWVGVGGVGGRGGMGGVVVRGYKEDKYEFILINSKHKLRLMNHMSLLVKLRQQNVKTKPENWYDMLEK